jgi:hypothetical protein
MATVTGPQSAEIAALCDSCQRGVFQDVYLLKQDVDQHAGRRFDEERSITSADYRWVDMLPHLPGLEKSFQDGCDLCGFIRDIVFSDTVNDYLGKSYGSRLQDYGDCAVTITLEYNLRLERSPRRFCLSSLVFVLNFSKVSLALRCGAEAVPGIKPTIDCDILPTYIA